MVEVMVDRDAEFIGVRGWISLWGLRSSTVIDQNLAFCSLI